MTDETLLTLRQLAEVLQLPESTVRYYRDAFIDHLPSVGKGRRRRYPAEAIPVLRSIATSYAAGRSRAEIIADIHDHTGSQPSSVAVTGSEQSQRTVPLEEVTNLDLLAAILDGEREQRDALWQMAKEIIRLTDVLAGQDQVISQIADHAGVKLESQPALRASAPAALNPAPAVSNGTAPTPSYFAPPEAAAPPAPSPVPPLPPLPPLPPIRDAQLEEHADAAHVVEPVPRFAVAGDVEKLKAELEAERALVERLRESKLQLEHRAADAEAALEDRKGRRPSVIRRLLGSDPQQ